MSEDLSREPWVRVEEPVYSSSQEDTDARLWTGVADDHSFSAGTEYGSLRPQSSIMGGEPAEKRSQTTSSSSGEDYGSSGVWVDIAGATLSETSPDWSNDMQNGLASSCISWSTDEIDELEPTCSEGGSILGAVDLEPVGKMSLGDLDCASIAEQIPSVDLAALAVTGILGSVDNDALKSESTARQKIECADVHRVESADGAMANTANAVAGTATAAATATGATLTAACPFCQQSCAEGKWNRLGLHWKKLGYRGPPYCKRCAFVFRSHIMRQQVSSICCSRETPCGRCSAVLKHFEQSSPEDIYRFMDEWIRNSKMVKAKVVELDGEISANTLAPCPYCGKHVLRSSLGLIW